MSRRPLPVPKDEALYRVAGLALAFARSVDASDFALSVAVPVLVPGDPADEYVPVPVHVIIERGEDGGTEDVKAVAGARTNPRRTIQAPGSMFDAVAKVQPLRLGGGS